MNTYHIDPRNSVLTLASLFKLSNKYPGSVEAKLVSEEDLMISLSLDKADEDIIFLTDESRPQRIKKGEGFTLSYCMHFDTQGVMGLQPHIEERFRQAREA